MIFTTTIGISQEGAIPLGTFMARVEEFKSQAEGRALNIRVVANTVQLAVEPTQDETMVSVYQQEIARHEALLTAARLERDRQERMISSCAKKLEELREVVERYK